jgi:hypothetical protein
MPKTFGYGASQPPITQRTETHKERRSGRVRKSPWVLIIFVLIGGLLGGILGEILHAMAPQGTIQSIFATNFNPGISPPLTIDLVLIKLVLGFNIKVNILSILGMFIGIYLYKHV